MSDIVEVNSGFENACRLCLTTERTRSSIFALPQINVPFTEKIRSCVSIQISSNDKLSTLVCSKCIDSINHWHSYKDSCLKSQEKLQQWLAKQSSLIQTVTIKEEPIDDGYENNSVQGVTNDANDANVSLSTKNAGKKSDSVLVELSGPEKDFQMINEIKTEPMDTEDEDDCNVDIESVASGELLINPMAVAVGNAVNNDRIMEADSTQKFSTKKYVARKRVRRGPHTHFRGTKLFKKKCVQCKITLHSKHSFMQHMSKYHGITNSLAPHEYTARGPLSKPKAKTSQKSSLQDNVENEPEDTQIPDYSPEDAEYVKMVTTAPLKSIQRNIISQLKTFTCYTCKKTFFDRRHTLNHIRQHLPGLKPYTCIACLTEFSDRSMYKLHCGASFECAMKIALVIPRTGSEKYFTCNMCLRSFNNRQELLMHLAAHMERQKPQSVRSPQKLKPMTTNYAPTSRIETSPSKKSISTLAGPYMNGDPAHNHMCDLCGMIYRYRPNMIKHRDLCNTLAEEIRTSYRCVHCSMTYLVYKKFYTHIFQEHKKREITCFTCHERFTTPDDYLTHHETHRTGGAPNFQLLSDAASNQLPATSNEDYSMVVDHLNSSTHPTDVGEKPFNCALCGESFVTKLELTEHRNLHLKVKIYSCVICRSMFSSSGALEIHMKDHGIHDSNEQAANSSCLEYGRGDSSQSSLNDSSLSTQSDPGSRFNRCGICGKNFSNYANLKRHEKNLHFKQRRRWSCDDCKRRFKSIEAFNEHLKITHGKPPHEQEALPQMSAAGKPMMQCPKCPKTFAYQGYLIQHCQTVHKENHYERAKATATARPFVPRGHSCDICGKTFREEQSLKTHRGWHLRTNYKLKINKTPPGTPVPEETVMSGPGYTVTAVPQAKTTAPKPAKARKSFPNNPSQKQLGMIANLQCQVCDDRFADVGELRKHLWDIHCARNKPEKSFTTDLQCELCTNKFPDKEALVNHMQWHKDNPILSDHPTGQDRVDEIVEAESALDEAITNLSAQDANKKPFCCDTCGKYYSNRKLFLRHQKFHKAAPASFMNFQSLQTKRPYCQPCQKPFSTEASLKRHKASPCHTFMVRAQRQVPGKKITTTAMVHEQASEPVKISLVKNELEGEYSANQGENQAATQVGKKRPVTCHICNSVFPNMSVLYQHKQLVHSKVPVNRKTVKQQPKECVPIISAEGMVCCNVCGKQFPGISNLRQHFSHKHKSKSNMFPCVAPGCKLVFTTAHSLKSHETVHATTIFNCLLCNRHVFSKSSIHKHMLTMHKAIYDSGASKNNLWTEIDLSSYHVKNAQGGTECPKCKVKYPNLRALKIHYIKFHEKMNS